MIIELFGPPGAGKTTLLRRVCHGMAERGVSVKTVNGYRLIEQASASQDVPETRHGIGRIGRKIATCGPILLATLPNNSVAARLLASLPLRSRTWSWRMKVDIALLWESWHIAQESEGCFIFEEGLIQALCAMLVFARNPSVDAIRDTLAFLPRPDILVQLDAPQETLRRRLVDRYAQQPFLEVLLFELGVERGLRQADLARQVGECLNREGWPLIQVNGDDPHNFEKVIAKVSAGHVKEIALARPDDVRPRFAGT
ncbi:AAA family ATPase [Mesorhizobium sp.]|uniref:AAA family ATPase n=1 Tax=Mesorhizobium sp. TaxID=1871066 RepID=UPI000FE8BA4F|nr:AAA family ATPase [Mesorhizobium sp.]RWD67625.1 MAG: AAA family ATPase [Mesorhizobium sp.]TIV59664.1 MAG: AAA family ATPase [Mesorhizobium sp.]